MASNSISQIIWRISLPIILVEATETFDHLIDTLFLARVGVVELGAIGVADSLLMLFLVLPLGLVDGVQVLTARRAGQRRCDAVGAVFNQGLLSVLLLGVASAAALQLFSPAITGWFVESRAVGAAVNSYLQWDAYSIPLAGATFAYSGLLTSLGRTRALVPAALILVVADVVLNYLFIFGKFGCPALGMRGAAVGSIGAEFLTAVFLTVYVRRQFNVARYGFFSFRRFDPRTTRLLRHIAAPIAAQRVLVDLRWAIFFLIIERVGTSALAVANIVFTCYVVFRVPTEGFAETACSLVSRCVGRKREHQIGRVLRKTIGGAVLATVPLLAVAMLAPQWLAAVFSLDADLFGQSSASMRVIALAMLAAIPGELWFTAVVGTGDTVAALAIELISTVVLLGLTWLAAIQLAWPMALVWFSVPIAWLVCLAASYGWMKLGIWKRIEA